MIGVEMVFEPLKTYILNDTRIYKEYDGLKLESGDFWNFTQEISQWAIKKHLSKLRQPVDKELWAMPVEETNAYYSPTDNSMVFPAGKSLKIDSKPIRVIFKESYSPHFIIPNILMDSIMALLV